MFTGVQRIFMRYLAFQIYALARMKTELLYLFIILLPLLSVSIYGGSDGKAHDLSVRSGVAEPAALAVWSYNASSKGNATSDNNTIVVENPTFQEVKDFILKDTTSRKQFVLDQYECRHFATEVDNNAEAAGLRAGFVLIGFERGQHAVIAFDTTDRGLIYIEPQTDAVVDVKVGGKYEGKEIKEILIAW